ncbi:hypothetical protein IAR55_000386 [Kwoniella newhampshirensis]|uniref:Letm1 RBD domain-containing protein n=1 Tax=Kwoniella newhampshirensis TaxID=1651941 RepID=A0AAW0Z6K8_9TREE
MDPLTSSILSTSTSSSSHTLSTSLASTRYSLTSTLVSSVNDDKHLYHAGPTSSNPPSPRKVGFIIALPRIMSQGTLVAEPQVMTPVSPTCPTSPSWTSIWTSTCSTLSPSSSSSPTKSTGRRKIGKSHRSSESARTIYHLSDKSRSTAVEGLWKDLSLLEKINYGVQASMSEKDGKDIEELVYIAPTYNKIIPWILDHPIATGLLAALPAAVLVALPADPPRNLSRKVLPSQMRDTLRYKRFKESLSELDREKEGNKGWRPADIFNGRSERMKRHLEDGVRDLQEMRRNTVILDDLQREREEWVDIEDEAKMEDEYGKTTEEGSAEEPRVEIWS